MQEAIDHEARRQVELLEDGGKVVQETRLYDPDRRETRSMRSKEDAQDYRYFPDPDLPPLVIDGAWIARVRASMPELPEAMQARFVRDHGLAPHESAALTASRETASYFESAARGTDAKAVANWMQGTLAAALNRADIDIARSPVPPAALAQLVARIADGTISGRIAKEVFDALWAGDGDVDAIVERRGLRQISDEGAIEKIVDEAIAANPSIVAEFRSGKEKARNALVGKIMAASRGKANPAQVDAILKRKL
jgi:aspartyl-tRNA(Asn)/glutamyl-tRNA(Gln) amidotransferase subunit B